MKKYLPLILIWISGVILHFLYDLTGRSWLVGLFAPVNESVWEHYKLAFWPLLTAGLVMAGQKGVINMAPPVVFSLTHTAFVTFGLNYLYTGAFGVENILTLDVANFFVSTAIGYWFLVRYSQYEYTNSTGITAMVSIIILALTLWWLTFHPVNLPIFIEK